jgi:hypothetical protein
MKKYKGVELSLQVQRMTRIEFFNSNYSFFKKDIKVREDGSKVWTSNGGSIEIDIYKDGSFSIGIKKKKGMSSTTQKYFLTNTFHLKNDDNYILNNEDLELFENLKKVKSLYTKIRDRLIKEIKEKEEQILKELQVSQTNVLNELDKDGNGEVDVIEGNDFNLLLKKHQKNIVEIDRTYVQKFVKISGYIKTKEKNIQSIFNLIKDTPNQEVLNEYVEVLKGDIHSYNLILFNSLNMIVSLVEDDMITFYEIYEIFDTLNLFDSKHEKDISQKLTNIGDGLEDLIYEVRHMGDQISSSISELTYVTEESNEQLTNQLSEIDSTLEVGNLINTINTYQNYKIKRRLNS